MKTVVPTYFATAFIAVVLVGPWTSALAASTWALDSCVGGTATGQFGSTSTTGGNGCVKGTNLGTGASANSVHAYAYANTGTSGKFSTAGLKTYGASSGLGVAYTGESSTAPDHAMDNNLKTELIAFKFDTSVILSQITFGYVFGDGDFSLLAWKGAAAPTPAEITGKTTSTLKSTSTSTGWQLVGNYANASGASESADRTVTVNDGGLGSSWWIVSAWNAGYGGNTGTGLGDGMADYMKVMTIASKDATTTKVPEPGSLALLAVGLIGLIGARRRQVS